WEGTVNLSLLILNDGELKEANISQSSGYKILDEAAVDAVIRQAPFPSFPSQVELHELNIEVPIAYRKGD
ncbi:MAG: energy transducer TonB, partial [Candidatus Omnitrophica bacterium]|nr:energy transducer TonB [Candidatus Omnitrophota bacterium]